MSQTEIHCVCAECGADLTREDRFRDHGGEYFCLPCHRARLGASADASFAESLRQCIFCGTWVARRDCHRNRYGEYVCRECRTAGRRWSQHQITRRRVRHWLIRSRRVVFVICATAVGLWGAYLILGKILDFSISHR